MKSLNAMSDALTAFIERQAASETPPSHVASSGKLGRAFRALGETDDMPAELRSCVHDYGYAIVRCLMDNGVTDPRRIRAVVHGVWDGARQPRQNMARSSKGPLGTLDWLLIQSKSEMSAITLVRALDAKNYAIVPREPTDSMVQASMATVSGGTVAMTKFTKHKMRLRAAITAAREGSGLYD